MILNKLILIHYLITTKLHNFVAYVGASGLDIDKIVEADSLAKENFRNKLLSLSKMTAEEMIKHITKGVIEIVLKILIAFIIYLICRWIIKRIRKILERIFQRRRVDVSLRGFLQSLISIILHIFMISIIIGVLGLDTTSFIALFASAGLALGLALSGTMQNFAGGVILLILKPFKVGDFVEAKGFTGTVKSIMLFYTVLNTTDNKTIIIPNGALSNDSINNYSKETTRRVQWEIGLDYGQSYERSRDIIAALLKLDGRVLRDPAFDIFLDSMGSDSIKIIIRAWCNSENYWDLYYSMNVQIYNAILKSGVEFAVPKLDLTVKERSDGGI